MGFAGGLWGVMIGGGIILLGLVIAWAMRNNKTSRKTLEQTEQATHDLYEGDPVDRTKR